MSLILNGKTYVVPLVILGLGVMTVASAQTSTSPFANKVKKKAWETAAPSVPTPSTSQYNNPFKPTANQIPSQIPSQTLPVRSPHTNSSYTPDSSVPNPRAYNYQTPASNAPQIFSDQDFSQTEDYSFAPQGSPYQNSTSPAPQSGAYYPGRSQAPYPQNTKTQYQGASTGSTGYDRGYGQPSQQGRSQARQQAGQQNYAKGSWIDRLGLKKWKTTLSGALRLGAAATDREETDRDGWNEDFIGDGRVTFEASAITAGGLEYGINLEARAQYDRYRRGFGGLVGDCAPDIAGCASVDINGTPTALRGHTSQFYTSGADNADDFEAELEGAYIFLRSAYGDVTVGRDDGAAYLFSLGAPTLLAVNASNSPVDYTGLDSVKTVNDASGFAEKVTYTSPRLLGDQIGVGVQLGLSYAPNARACGVDYCVRSNGSDESGAFSPDLDDVFEVGLSLDRKFANGLEVEATGTYAIASEQSGLEAFDDLSAYNAGIEIKLSDWTVGGSYLQSNNGLNDGDYTAWDAGITWKPSKIGFSASYGYAEDENINLTSDQIVAGISYEFDRFTLGTGVQYIERTVPIATGLVVGEETEKATAIFVEGGFTF